MNGAVPAPACGPSAGPALDGRGSGPDVRQLPVPAGRLPLRLPLLQGERGMPVHDRHRCGHRRL